MEKDKVVDREDKIVFECQACGDSYIERDEKEEIWNPAWDLPVGICSYGKFHLCAVCKSKILIFLKETITKKDKVVDREEKIVPLLERAELYNGRLVFHNSDVLECLEALEKKKFNAFIPNEKDVVLWSDVLKCFGVEK